MVQRYDTTSATGVSDEDKPTKGHCPLCKKSTTFSFRPFCSKKCKMVDLYRWVSGHYVIPGDPDAVLQKEEDEDRDDWKKSSEDENL